MSCNDKEQITQDQMHLKRQAPPKSQIRAYNSEHNAEQNLNGKMLN